MSSPGPFLQNFYNAVAASTEASNRPVWSQQTNRWLVFNPGTASQVLRSKEFSVVKHHEDIDALQRTLALDLRSTVDAARAMPLSHEGEEHRDLKRQSAQLIQGSSELALSSFRAYCSILLPSLLDGRRSFDIVKDFVSPASVRLFSALTGVEECHFNKSIPAGYCPTQLLTSTKQSLSVPRWRALNTQLAERYKRMEGPSSHRVMRSALSLLTFEIFKAALSNSLIYVFQRSSGLPINEMDIPGQLPCTSIPFIDRICRRDVEMCGEHIRKGDNVLVYLGGCSPSGPKDRKLFFGTGPHICIGKSLTESAWSVVADCLGQRRERITVRDVTFREFDVILLSPDSATIEVMQ